ncbi:MAG: quinoprotein relay system zinc metallohydrolase 2 [Hyphomicrobiales bacterium]|nr:quinoprotein relay system zinc metallohydrolase 2 [Hyphomicrobiales bacterium]
MHASLSTLATGSFLYILVSYAPAYAENDVTPLPLTEVAPGVLVFQGAHQLFTPQNQGAICNVGFIIGDAAVAVIDTGGSLIQGQRLKAAIRARTSLPIRYVINTHMHPDHIFGNAAFTQEAGVQFVGHAKLGRALKAREQIYITANSRLLGEMAAKGLQIVLPTLAVADTMEIDLGRRVLHLKAQPTAHTDNDLTVFDDATKTLFAGDLLFSGHLPAIDGSVKGWLRVMENLASVKASRVVPGHGPAAMPWPEAMAPQTRYFGQLIDDIRAAIRSGTPLSEAARTAGVSEQGAWELFEDFNARNAATVFAELEWDE